MSNRERFARKTHFTTSAKAVSIVLTAGFVALLVSRTPMHLTEEYVLPAPTVAEQSDGQAGPIGLTLSAEQYEAAVRSAKQDDPPIASF
jgi:hypothetical protein